LGMHLDLEMKSLYELKLLKKLNIQLNKNIESVT
jgi:hypothetical protein